MVLISLFVTATIMPIVLFNVPAVQNDRVGMFTVAGIAIELGLRARVVVEVMQERRRRARQLVALRLARELFPRRQDLLARRLAVELHEHGSHVPVAHRDADALRGDRR